ncbi:MAG: MFS transporter [Clostridia bacterium]|nr:MFS transporter [Clostridia bacterium]
MKLNYRRTIFVGFAFFLICAFWQAYDNIIALTLTNKFGMPQAYSGIIMAFDNVLALFMLPLFGALSDKCHTKIGKRTPFIIVGTILAAVAFIALSFVDNMQLTNIADVKNVDSESSLAVLYDYDYGDFILKDTDGKPFVIQEKFDRDTFLSIRTDTVWDEEGNDVTDDTSYTGERISPYSEYVAPARQAYAWKATLTNPTTLIFFVGLLLIVLVSMSIFRSPAVALMPDVTPKPLRSKGNAVINLMGSAGGVFVLVLGMIIGTGSAKNGLMSYVVFFSIVAALMIVSLIIFLLTVKENRFVQEMEEQSRHFGIDESAQSDAAGNRKLSRGEILSLLLILASVALWYMGYNAVTSKYSVYASNILQKDYNMTLIIAQAAAIISYLPVGMISSKLGRKKCILAGVLILGVAFGSAYFAGPTTPALLMNILFALAGIGWATINVNSFPMVVELAKGGNVGKYTGYYYTASMAAQVFTPFLSGIFMDNIGMTTLFPYATIFVAGSFVTMLFVKHGDSVAAPKASMLENFDIED